MRRKYNSYEEYTKARGWVFRKPTDMKARRRYRRRQRRRFVRAKKETSA